MKKFLIVVFIFSFIQIQAVALDVVYPKNSQVKINSNATFFVGSANPDEKLTINGKEIKIHKSGAFAQSVLLETGINIFKIVSGCDETIYTIERSRNTSSSALSQKFFKYPTAKTAVITKNGAPLRSTPIQSGINRLAHFQAGLELEIDGEKGELYRVVLSPNYYAWIAKSDVKVNSELLGNVFLYDYRSRESEEFYIYEFALSKKTPFVITEGDVMILKIFNIKDNPNSTALFNITLNQRLMGYNAYFKGDTLVLKIRKQPDVNKRCPLKDIKIVIDAGHGGREQGAIGCCRDAEKDFNLKIAKYIDKELRLMGADVILTRHIDKYLDLKERVDFTNNHEAMIFVSIHANSLPDNADPQKCRGSSVYYYYNQAKPLAECILNSVTKNMKINSEGLKQASFAVVRNTQAVSVLIETAYVINPEDNSLLMSDDFRKDYARAVAEGIKNYILLK